MVGLAQGAIDAAVPYTKERQQFKKPIFEFQVIILLLIYSRNMFVIFNLPTNCLSVFDHFVILVLKGLIFQRIVNFCTDYIPLSRWHFGV